MSKIILGIHGLGNKPPKDVLERWWKISILEGLEAIGRPKRSLKFELVYWADLLHPAPLDPEEGDPDHPLFLEDPYVPMGELQETRPLKLGDKVLAYLEKQLRKIYLDNDFSVNYTPIPDLIIRHYFRDLNIYYSRNCIKPERSSCPAKVAIREQLADVLEKHRKREVLLIAHSMGSIIAYDVLRWSVPHINLDTLVTIGSPLGLPTVIMKILGEQGIHYEKGKKVKTPENVIRVWCNFSDRQEIRRIRMRSVFAKIQS